MVDFISSCKLLLLYRDGMDEIRQEKIQRFEEFVDLRLKPDLVHAISERYLLLYLLFSLQTFLWLFS